MYQKNEIVGFEEAAGPDGTLQRVLVACNLTSGAAPRGAVRYWEYLFTPEQVAAYEQATDKGEYVRGVIAAASPAALERWLAEAADRGPEPRRYSPEEIRARLGGPVEVGRKGSGPGEGQGASLPGENRS